MLENRREPMQEQAWWKLHCASWLLVFCAVVWCCLLVAKWVMKKNIQTYPYSNCTFHHQNSQRKQTSFTVPTNLGKTLANIIYCMCIFQHVGKQDRNHARTNMVKIALRKLFAGILCGCVVLLVLVVKWVMKKTIQPHPYSNCIFHHQNSQRKQTSFKVPTNLIENIDQHNLLHVSLSACWKTGQNPCKNTHGENCIAQVGCWYFVRLCGAACWLRSEWWKKTSKPIHILTALFTTGFHKEYKQILPYRPTSWKPWPTSSTVRVSVTTFENRTGSMQEQIWSKLHCASCLLVFCVVEWCCWCCSLVVIGKKPSNHIQAIF